jgi:hypothetical protein
MDAVKRITAALKEEASGRFKLIDGTEVGGSILDGRAAK